MNLVEGRASSLFENLKQFMHHSSYKEKEFLKPVEPTYCDKLRVTLEFLARSQPPTRVEVIERLGNGNKALDSVPTAIYSFLYATKYDMLPEMSTPIKSPVLRCIFHAISLGGETDTVASMAGAIAGAYWVIPKFPMKSSGFVKVGRRR
ncbi:Poly(ADP-ribose) glycohydrolase ARH3 [Orchesella cincta]|uniref:Poly(ADP-ribose) glycohydrolase ARH3 n=1 Tax=Orchesella cincta TaxID=48709 RepID=A0A1D2N114_ORCCI|nr:Poly(ADP-ribose) glycohydrolase ARH3 [Orchesella cincta]